MKSFLAVIGLVVLGCSAEAMTPDRFVEYVESTGTQYVDLGVKASGHLKVQTDVVWPQVPSDDTLVGARAGDNRLFLVHNTGGQICYGYGGFNYSSYRPPVGQKTHVISDFQTGAQTILADGNNIVAATDGADLDLNLNLYLFACNRDGRADFKTKARVYAFKLWRNDELVRDLQPCVKDGVAGLYDAKSGEILYGAKDALVAGPDFVRETPEIFLESLASDGKQFVDVDVLGRNGTKAELDMEMLSGGDVTLLGSGAGSTKRFYLIHSYNLILAYGFNGFMFNSWSMPEEYHFNLGTGVRHVVTGEIDRGRQEIAADGQSVYVSNSVENVEKPLSLYLFGCHSVVQGVESADYKSKMRVYRAKIWQDGALVRDLVPCICRRRIGFFDEVSGRFFTATNRAFSVEGCGPITNIVDSQIRKPDNVLEYVARTGSDQWVDTGVVGKGGVGMETEMTWTAVPTDGSYLAARKGTDTRYYLYHHYQGHMLAYGDYTTYQTKVLASADVRYRVKSLVKSGEQSLTVDALTNGEWTRQASLSKKTEKDVDTGYSLYLFACNKDGGGELWGVVALPQAQDVAGRRTRPRLRSG